MALLMNEHRPEPIDEAVPLRAWTDPEVDRDRDVRLGADECVLVSEENDGKVWLDLHGRPSLELLDWAESRARHKGARRMFAGAWETDRPVSAALEKRGFRRVRHSVRMMIDLDAPTPDPVWPDGLAVRTFRPGDERVFYEVHQETFRDHWEHREWPFEPWCHWVLDKAIFDPSLYFLAVAGNEPAGVEICFVDPVTRDLGWVGILGVRRPHRGRGLGRALLLHAFAEFRERGLERAVLGVDAESVTGAHRLYESVGMRVTHRSHIYEKELT